MIRSALRAVWDEPAVAAPPGRPWWDVALVAVLVPASVVEGLVRDDVPWPPFSIALAGVCAVALLWRRTHPLVALLVGYGAQTVAGVVPDLAGHDYGVLLTTSCVLLLPYSLARWGSGRAIVVGLAYLLVAHVAREPLYDSSGISIVVGAGFLLLPAALGVAVRFQVTARRRGLDQIRLREREQLARELHDTVAHHVSGIVIQAQAGRAVAGADPQRAVEVLGVIEDAATRALVEMRAIVGILRDGAEAERAPVPGVGDLRRLVDDPAARLPVELHVEGDVADLPPAIGTVVFRLVQESVTNAQRHARGATGVVVSVVGGADAVTVTVVDDGTSASERRGSGYGLTGMAERVALVGGELEAGPAAAGWRVEARLPVAAAVVDAETGARA